jgi:hypothetical protein
MLGRLSPWRHVAVLLVVLGSAVLAFAGIIGNGSRDEIFDAKQVTVQPAGTDGVRITEVVDEDFGAQDRHGYQRIIPNDFGKPTDVVASSPDADATLNVFASSFDTTIRLGNPASTVTGQHRYVLAYTLPDAHLSAGTLSLDIIGTDETLETKRFEVIVAGMVLKAPTCNVGSTRTFGGCTLTQDGDLYRVVFTPLHKGDGITIGGTITARADVAQPALPPLPERRPNHKVPLGLALIGVGLVSALLVFLLERRAGRNEVVAGGAADAAYGVPVLPNPAAPGRAAAPAALAGSMVTMVADDQLAKLATTEFVPPKGLEPWQGAVLLTERIDNSTVSAWFSALVAREIVAVDDKGDRPTMGYGDHPERADPQTATTLGLMLHGGSVHLGTYDPVFATSWNSIKKQQAAAIGASGWWRRRPPTPGAGSGVQGMQLIGPFLAVVVLFGGIGAVGAKALTTIPLAIVLGAVASGLAAFVAYHSLLRSRSVTGSALAIRTESFRRFLVASEGKHVDWAWQHGLLREYSAWAVALGAADAWSRALSASNVPIQQQTFNNPLVVYALASSFAHTSVRPSSSGSGGSSGFSGGGVGGGGGGGSSGSW